MSRADFWSKRKAAVEAEEQAELVARDAEAAEAREAELAEKSDEEILEELGLPAPEDLGEGDDFRVFLTDKVPARLRTRALRRLWTTNPVLANVDGLVDYGEDFTDAACVIENMQTAYQVGKGMTKHVEEMARQAAEAEAEPVELVEAEADPEVEEIPEVQESLCAEPEPCKTDEAPDPDHGDEDVAYEPKRRMRFAFEDPGAGA